MTTPTGRRLRGQPPARESAPPRGARRCVETARRPVVLVGDLALAGAVRDWLAEFWAGYPEALRQGYRDAHPDKPAVRAERALARAEGR